MIDKLSNIVSRIFANERWNREMIYPGARVIASTIEEREEKEKKTG